MIDARVFVDNLAIARKTLQEENAELRGMYEIHDTIYRNRNESIPLSEEFLRIREVPKNIWDEKPFLITLKQTKLQKVGKSSLIPLKIEFESLNEALEYYKEHFKDRYVQDFDFRRVGWQYFMPNGDGVDLEIVEDIYPTIEFKSKNEDGIKELLKKFTINDEAVIKGPSIVAVRELLKI